MSKSEMTQTADSGQPAFNLLNWIDHTAEHLMDTGDLGLQGIAVVGPNQHVVWWGSQNDYEAYSHVRGALFDVLDVDVVDKDYSSDIDLYAQLIVRPTYRRLVATLKAARLIYEAEAKLSVPSDSVTDDE